MFWARKIKEDKTPWRWTLRRKDGSVLAFATEPIQLKSLFDKKTLIEGSEIYDKKLDKIIKSLDDIK
jgi:hypothetical protein